MIRSKPGKSYQRGRNSMVYLFLSTFYIENIIYFFYKTSYLNEEVNRTELCPSVSVLCLNQPNLTIHLRYIFNSRGTVCSRYDFRRNGMAPPNIVSVMSPNFWMFAVRTQLFRAKGSAPCGLSETHLNRSE